MLVLGHLNSIITKCAMFTISCEVWNRDRKISHIKYGILHCSFIVVALGEPYQQPLEVHEVGFRKAWRSSDNPQSFVRHFVSSVIIKSIPYTSKSIALEFTYTRARNLHEGIKNYASQCKVEITGNSYQCISKLIFYITNYFQWFLPYIARLN